MEKKTLKCVLARKGIIMDNTQVVIALNGQLQGNVDDYIPIIKKEYSTFIAADGGVLLLEELKITPDVLLGDFDSISEDKIRFYQKNGVKTIKYPTEKNETDGELALEYCLENNLDNIVIIGALGGRLDHQLANIFLMEYAHYHDLKAVIRDPGLEMGLIIHKKTFNNCVGEYLSLIPLSKEVSGVSIKGCKYSLNNEQLYRYKTRGISNLMTKEKVDVSVEEGILIYLKHKYT